MFTKSFLFPNTSFFTLFIIRNTASGNEMASVFFCFLGLLVFNVTSTLTLVHPLGKTTNSPELRLKSGGYLLYPGPS